VLSVAEAIMNAPDDLVPRGRGRRFWNEVVKRFELSAAEREILSEVCRCLDEIDGLRAAVTTTGTTTAGSRNQLVVNPALSELRQARAELRRLLEMLSLPDPEQDNGKAVTGARSARAAKAARTRWQVHSGPR
jgi:Phage terminase, small subunit